MLYPFADTLGTVKQDILKVVGKQGDTDAQATAGTIIGDIIRGLNSCRDWKFLRGKADFNVTTDGLITLTTGTAARFKKIYAVIWNNDYPLQYMPERDWWMQTGGGGSGGTVMGGTYVYGAFVLGASDVLQVRDAPTANTTATVYYQKRIVIPATDNASFTDVPEEMGEYLRCMGRARVCAEFDQQNVTTYRMWKNEATEALANLKRDDSQMFPDHIQQWIPQMSYVPFRSPAYGYLYGGVY